LSLYFAVSPVNWQLSSGRVNHDRSFGCHFRCNWFSWCSVENVPF